MQKAWTTKLGLVLGIAALGLACGDDTGEVGSGGSGSSGTGEASTGGATTMNGMTSTPMTSNAEGDTTSADVSTSGPPGDTTADGSSGGSSGPPGTEGSSSGGMPPGAAYPPCAPDSDPPCPEPYDQCVQLGGGGGGSQGNWCSIACMDDTECPAPDSGAAVPVCGGPPMQDTRCQLDCSMGDCPDGMSCVGVGPGGAVMLCAWPAP